MLIITDLDGTLTDERHRHQYILLDDEISFYNDSKNDDVNQHGLDLINYIKTLHMGHTRTILVLTARPETYENKSKTEIDYRTKTTNWLNSKHIRFDSLLMRDSSVDGALAKEDKVKRFKTAMLEHMEEKDIYFLDNEESVARRVKSDCPRVHVYLVTYGGYSEIT